MDYSNFFPPPRFPTPSGWPLGRTLESIGRPCLSKASWSALLKLASVPSDLARQGVNGFGYFCLHNNGCALRDAPSKSSPAGARPGNIENCLDIIVWNTRAWTSTVQGVTPIKDRMDSRLKMSGMTGKNACRILRCLGRRGSPLIFNPGIFGMMLLVAVDHVAGHDSQGSLGGAIGE